MIGTVDANENERLVRLSNEAFYKAFRERDIDRMQALWATGGSCACAHPGMDVIIGRAAVLDSWRGMLSHRESPQLHCSGVTVHLLGQSAFVTCFEGTVGDPPALLATNVFLFEDGQWRLVHHHAGALSSRNREPLTASPDPRTLN